MDAPRPNADLPASNPDRLMADLLDRYLAGLISEAELADLAARIRQDRAFAEEFAQACRLEARLFERFRASKAALDIEAMLSAPLKAHHRTHRPRPARHTWTFGLASAAAIVVAAVLAAALWLRNPGGLMPEPVAAGDVLTGSIVSDRGPVSRVPIGEEVRPAGDVLAVVRLSDGSRAQLQPAAVVVFRGPAAGLRQQVELRAGSARFEVSKGPGDFEVTTSLGRVTALGTVFSVGLLTQAPGEKAADGPGLRHDALSVVVTSGAVRVDSGGKSYRLGAGDDCVFRPGAGEQARFQRRPGDREGSREAPDLRLPEAAVPMDKVVGFTDEQKRRIIELNRAREAALKEVAARFQAEVTGLMTPQQRVKWDVVGEGEPPTGARPSGEPSSSRVGEGRR